MKLFSRKQKPSKLVDEKYSYQQFYDYKQQKLTDALIERVADEIHLKLSDKKVKQ